MYIEEVVIDGFKSYAHRTVIKGFDPHFNAITGLNGSGKSNILDSICFVLGITNLSQVRAGSLSELVYKQGQAGVNKAIVTIIFNNENGSCSPVGYEQCKEVTVTRQVLIGGKSKYLINGRNAPAGQVQNLFHSVQLNVNNPHFLIMQGRITKVLNMKPHEILGMIEEAAGTRMYETKRVAALRTIEKKQAKVDELNAILSEEITPTLERLRGEKQNYLKWSKNSADIERIERFVIAKDFMTAKQSLANNSEGSDDMSDKIDELKRDRDKLKRDIAAIDDEVTSLSSKLRGKFADEHVQAKAKQDKFSKELVKVTSTWQNSKDDVAKAGKDLEAAKLCVEETRTLRAAKEEEVSSESRMKEQQLQAANSAKQKWNQLKEDYDNMLAGIESSQGEEGRSIKERINQAKTDAKTAEAKAKQTESKIEHLKQDLNEIRHKMEKEKADSTARVISRDEEQARVDMLQGQLQELGFSPTEFEALDKKKIQLETHLSELSTTLESLSSHLEGYLRFQYKDPVRGFDRSKIKGKVAQLIMVKDRKHVTSLQIVAGGKLFHVVVDDSVTGKALLAKGQLTKRVWLIPLADIKSRIIPDSVARKACVVAKSLNSKAVPAIELIEFDEEVRAAMEHVFGSSLVVDGPNAANKICDEIKQRTVTLEGDVYDPSGTISGGSKKEDDRPILELLAELAELKQEHDQKEDACRSVVEKVRKMKPKSVQHHDLESALVIARAQLAGAEQHLRQTKYGQLRDRHIEQSQKLRESLAAFEEYKKEKELKAKLYHDLSSRETELTHERENRISGLQSAIKEAKADFDKKEKGSREAHSKFHTLNLELESLRDELAAAQSAARAAEKHLDEARRQQSDLQIVVGEVSARFNDAKDKFQAAEHRAKLGSQELSNLNKQRSKKLSEQQKATVEITKLQVAISKMEKDKAAAERTVASMLKSYSWIESEQNAFGLTGGDYDFSAVDAKAVQRELQALRSQQESLAKKINKKVMGMIEKAESEYTELLRKRKVVENDKKKIQAVIEELDVKKKTELERTWKKVNGDFGSIFSTLLPGASAKLEPPSGMEAWQGLEVRVAFGDVWKESLSELSGGQRSLLALSLILSLLLFKPAPMYILDEVDAALDLSHTQNIGNMLKTHFSQSQFIVVSLKEGMFNNANVILRTKFVDGVSTVTRTIGTGSSRSSRNTLPDSQKKIRVPEKSSCRPGAQEEKENIV